MQEGVISRLNREREYGKIRTKKGEEAHFHRDCLWNTRFGDLTEGQDVEFEVQSSYNGDLAFHIRLIHQEAIQQKRRVAMGDKGKKDKVKKSSQKKVKQGKKSK